MITTLAVTVDTSDDAPRCIDACSKLVKNIAIIAEYQTKIFEGVHSWKILSVNLDGAMFIDTLPDIQLQTKLLHGLVGLGLDLLVEVSRTSSEHRSKKLTMI